MSVPARIATRSVAGGDASGFGRMHGQGRPCLFVAARASSFCAILISGPDANHLCYPKDIAKHKLAARKKTSLNTSSPVDQLTPYRLLSVSFHDFFPLGHVGEDLSSQKLDHS